jgi:general secretion pathway protein K
MWSELDAADVSQCNIKLRCIAKSGYNYAISLLYEDNTNNDFDSMQDNWADSASIAEEVSSMFVEGTLDLVIRDLSGKININRLVNSEGDFDPKQKELLSRFLSNREFDINPEAISDILDSIKDWIDPDDEVTRFGAESGYYESLENPYKCRNGSLGSLEEMVLIKGITNDLLFGNEHSPGIINFLTVYGDGKINLNTASPMVLRSLSDDIDQEMVDDLIAYREENEQSLGNILWYKDALGTEEDLFDQQIISISSNNFEIESRSSITNRSAVLRSVVKREGGKFVIMKWGYI